MGIPAKLSTGSKNCLAKIRIPLLQLNASGGLRIITEMANCLASTSYEVEIVVPAFTSQAHFPFHQNVTVKRIALGGGQRLGLFFFLLWMMIFSCRRTDICLATYYLTPFPIWVSWWLHGRKSKLLYLIQHYEPLSRVMLDDHKPALVKAVLYRIAQWGYRLPFYQVAVSEWIKTRVGKAGIIVIPNGVDESVFYPQDKVNNQLVIGAVGRTGPTKGFSVLLEALKPFIPAATIRILSDENLNLPDGVEHLRPRSDGDISRFYQDCDIFVFTSQLEGFGLPPLEAMACAAAVITTDCGGVRTFATEQNSLIVPTNDVMGLRQAIQRLLDDDELRDRLRAEGLKTAQQFTLSRMCEQYIALMSDILKETPHRENFTCRGRTP
jgi:glycosyltransferase involved in cell wall biosynthesis